MTSSVKQKTTYILGAGFSFNAGLPIQSELEGFVFHDMHLTNVIFKIITALILD